MLRNKVYYNLKPFIPRQLQIMVRRSVVRRKRRKYKDVWPIDDRAGTIPDNWTGWPDNKQFALILMHDVDTAGGQDKCHELVALEEKSGFRSSFFFVPERYKPSREIREYILSKGFEVGVHGLNHDGKLYSSRKKFIEDAVKINRYLQKWNAAGFSSPSMHSNLKWNHDLSIQYDISTFDTDPFEPYPSCVRTIFPFWVSHVSSLSGYVEIPYTLPQDFTLFVLMKERTIEIWKKKLDWIAEKGGMAMVNVHPDYMNFNGGKLGLEEYPAKFYEDFLDYVRSKYEGKYWNTLPRIMARYITKTTFNNKKV